MTLLFSDNFNRADGPLGGAWINITNAPTILTNRVHGTVNADNIAINPAATGYPDHSAQFSILAGVAGPRQPLLIVRSDLTFSNALFIRIYPNAGGGAIGVVLYTRVNGVNTALVALYSTPSGADTHTYRLEAVGTRIRLYIDDVLWLTHYSASVLGGDYVGLSPHAFEVYLDNFLVYDAFTAGLSCFPSEVPADSVDTAITLWGEGTAWTPGTPGSPIFTSLLGTITFQNVIDAVTAVILYTAPAYQCTEVLSDPDSGAYAYLGIGQPAPGYPTDSMQPYVAAMGVAGVNPAVWVALLEMLLPLIMPGTGGGDVNRILAILGDDTQQPSFQDNWLQLVTNIAWIGGSWVNGAPPSESVRAVAEGARGAAQGAYAEALSIRGDPPTDLASVRDAIRGVGGSTIYDVLVAIAAIGGFDLTPVLDELAVIRTNQNYTLGSIMANIDAMRTASAWTLGEVIDAVNAVRGSGTPTIADVLTAIANLPPPDVDLQPVLDAIAGLSSQVSTVQATANTINGKADDIHAHVDTLETSAANIYSFLGDLHTDVGLLGSGLFSALSVLTDLIVGKFALVMEAAEAIIALIGALVAPPPVHPVWPGLDNVDLGAEVPVNGSTFIAQPMHGLLITRLTKQVYDGTWGGGGRHYARHWAKAAFETAEGHTEPFQYLGWESSVLVPLQMVQAAGVTLYLEAGCTATVQPWTYAE